MLEERRDVGNTKIQGYPRHLRPKSWLSSCRRPLSVDFGTCGVGGTPRYDPSRPSAHQVDGSFFKIQCGIWCVSMTLGNLLSAAVCPFFSGCSTRPGLSCIRTLVRWLTLGWVFFLFFFPPNLFVSYCLFSWASRSKAYSGRHGRRVLGGATFMVCGMKDKGEIETLHGIPPLLHTRWNNWPSSFPAYRSHTRYRYLVDEFWVCVFTSIHSSFFCTGTQLHSSTMGAVAASRWIVPYVLERTYCICTSEL